MTDDASKSQRDPLLSWRVVGVVATLGIAGSVPLYFALHPVRHPRLLPPEARYIGSERCQACHPREFQTWSRSHHALAMQPARENSVLGDFSGTTFELRGQRWRFSRSGEKYLATAEGPDGALHDFEIVYTLGVDPLQQYLVAFPGGRLQCLSVAWDTRGRRWFFLYPGRDIPPTDWLHWTRPAQTWNTMCADCHSTAVRKRYDPEADAFQTTWSEIGVGCEACHGPASLHAAWAEEPAMARREIDGAALPTRTSGLAGRELVELCAPCHARRAQFADQDHPGGELLDRYLPALLSPGGFHPDGQIQDEDFEYHSFVQSKMYARGVKCGDCHDVHSGKRHEAGNDLCTRCHAADTYDTSSHHFHRREVAGRPSLGAQCSSCHMPGQNYMVVHFRRDHSLRLPRPDLSAALHTPLACAASGCHSDKRASWTAERYTLWYGQARKPHYGTVLAAGRARSPEAIDDLVRLAQDALRPTVVRATALELLGGYGERAGAQALELALADPDALLRHTAARNLGGADLDRMARLLSPLLADPVRGVRVEAAARLSEVPANLLSPSARPAFGKALDEYVAAQRYMSDLPSGPFNLGNLYARQGRPAEAERQYRRALRIDGELTEAKVNLALLLAGERRAEEALSLLREAHAAHPRLANVAFNLGLLLAEQGQPSEAERVLRDVLSADPTLAAAAHNLAVLVGPHRPGEAIALSRRAAALAPDEPRYAVALAFHQAKAQDFAGAVATLEALTLLHPTYGETYLSLGEIYERLGRLNDARALYARARDATDLSPEIRAALAARAGRLAAHDAGK